MKAGLTLSRAERKVAANIMRKNAASWPAHLVEVPESEWPAHRPEHGPRAVRIWRSRHYFAQQYAVPTLGNIEVRQLTVNRVTMRGDGHWDQDIPWDDLQRCKRETGHGDWYAVEVYPRDRDLVHVANMRHLWLLAEPLGIGWFAGAVP